jgi:DNA-binding MarR family transcriptional regulator
MSKQHYHAATYTPKTSVGYLVKRANALMLDTLEPAVAVQGFTFMQYVVMTYLRDGIALNPKDICVAFRHDSGALTRVIDQLVERGFVERARGVLDRRKVDLALTAAGRRAVETLIPTVVDKLNAVLGDFSTAEVRELSRLLNKLNDTMGLELGTLPAAVSADAKD